jgi:hypothetical protein
MEGVDRDLIKGAAMAFTWMYWRKSQRRNLIQDSRCPSQILNRDLQYETEFGLFLNGPRSFRGLIFPLDENRGDREMAYLLKI